jgi:hypothetical protein
MKSAIAGCALLLLAVAVWAEPAFARSYLHCLTKKVVIVDAPRGSTSSSIEERTLASGLMKQRKPSCLPMLRRLQSGGLTSAGLALLAAMCLMSSIVKMEI